MMFGVCSGSGVQFAANPWSVYSKEKCDYTSEWPLSAFVLRLCVSGDRLTGRVLIRVQTPGCFLGAQPTVGPAQER